MNNTVAQSLKTLSSNPLRTGLTTLGLVIGVATVIMILSAGAGFKGLINSQIETLGNNTLFIQTRVPPTTKYRASKLTPGIAAGITTLKKRDLDDVNRLSNVTNSYGMVTGLAVSSYRNQEKSVIYYGTMVEQFSIDKHELEKGRFFTPAEDTGAAQVVLMGNKLAKDLFLQDDPIDKMVRLGNLNFKVIGVYKPEGGLDQSFDDGLYMPLSTAQKKMLGIDHIAIAVVAMENEQLAEVTAESIKLVLRRNHDISHPDKDDFIVMTQGQVLDIYNTIFNGITLLLVFIAAISLVVGGVGIMNIMYVSVAERTSEIGLKKAVGASNKDILFEFLVESLLITVLGGVIGILLGSLLSWLVAIIATFAGLVWTFTIPFYGIVLAVGVSGAIGICFGVFPARSAAKLDPIAAMRAE